jgi:hypothetical protein
VVEHGLGEGLSLRGLSQIGSEPEGLHDGQVGLDGEHGSARPLLFKEYLSASLVEDGVDAADGVLGALNLNYGERQAIASGQSGVVHTKVDGLL